MRLCICFYKNYFKFFNLIEHLFNSNKVPFAIVRTLTSFTPIDCFPSDLALTENIPLQTPADF